MKKCGVCKLELGVFTSKYSCLDGYICRGCFSQAHIPSKMVKSTSVEDIKKRIFNKENTEKVEQQKIQRKHEAAAKLAEEKKYTDIDGYIKIDFANHKFKLKGSILTFDFEQLMSYEYIEQEKIEQHSMSSTKKDNGIARSVVGGIIAGGIGAIVGAETAKSTTTTNGTINKVIDKMQIKLVIAPENSIYTLDLLNYSANKYSEQYNKTYDEAQKILGHLSTIKSTNEKVFTPEPAIVESKPIQNQLSIPEEIKQYKELLDIGAITQEEYDLKKRQLLDL